ncbi:STM4504/CBY_0614 family protein [Aneurinibacillus tyrosinisolvens]|uniref:STM4504/CBY_0614 family protein n=1 Tax=Aneurinibacillus tyrosinisolvens TaxID=1443435 RepID=UPI00063F6A3D|nr:hypothetical protein [Aneurinibacillus tyrosinisolvens]
MGVLDIFSKRHTENKKEIFTYDNIPDEFRVQIIHIWNDSIGPYKIINNYYFRETSPSNVIWETIHSGLSKEYGVFGLSTNGSTPYEKCIWFIQEEGSVEKVLDIIELSIRAIDVLVRDWSNRWGEMGVTQKPDDAILELNERFQEHGLGYQYIKGNIVRVDSDYIYKEAVKPAVQLLFDENFEGASEEFLKAHEHFRKGQDKEAITESLKAFESVMKTICKRMGWNVDERATASKLISVLFENELLPSHLQTQVTSLKATLEGLATIRNRNSGHGQGEKSVIVSRHLVAYALHLCATNIVFLIDSYKSLKK